jgi:hypothetical protein
MCALTAQHGAAAFSKYPLSLAPRSAAGFGSALKAIRENEKKTTFQYVLEYVKCTLYQVPLVPYREEYVGVYVRQRPSPWTHATGCSAGANGSG